MAINDNTTFQEINDFFFEKFKDFQMQEIFSIYDCETGAKNIYSIEDTIAEFLFIHSYILDQNLHRTPAFNRLIKVDIFDNNSSENTFLKDLGIEEYYHENSNTYIGIYNYHQTYRFALKQMLKEHKTNLFLNENYSIEEVNINLLTDFLHTYVLKDLFFNEED